MRYKANIVTTTISEHEVVIEAQNKEEAEDIASNLESPWTECDGIVSVDNIFWEQDETCDIKGQDDD